jgi:hypothetical protein
MTIHIISDTYESARIYANSLNEEKFIYVMVPTSLLGAKKLKLHITKNANLRPNYGMIMIQVKALLHRGEAEIFYEPDDGV